MKSSEILYPGKVVVDEIGISVIVSVDENGIATAKTLLPKSAFVEAYNKYIAEPLINTTEVHLKPEIDEEGKAFFNGVCPYIDKICDSWSCSKCKEEERERKYRKGESQ